MPPMRRWRSHGSAGWRGSPARWATRTRPAAAFIFDRLEGEGIETRHILHVPGTVTPISTILIDATGERTAVTYRDPRLWTVELPASDTLLDGVDAVLDREPLRPLHHRAVRRRPRARHPGGDRRRPRHAADEPLLAVSSHRDLLRRGVARHRGRRRPGESAGAARAADAGVPGGHRRRTGHVLARCGHHCGTRRRFRSRPSIRSAPATSFMAPLRWRSPKGRAGAGAAVRLGRRRAQMQPLRRRLCRAASP